MCAKNGLYINIKPRSMTYKLTELSWLENDKNRRQKLEILEMAFAEELFKYESNPERDVAKFRKKLAAKAKKIADFIHGYDMNINLRMNDFYKEDESLN